MLQSDHWPLNQSPFLPFLWKWLFRFGRLRGGSYVGLTQID
jgi:hypothetical protein